MKSNGSLIVAQGDRHCKRVRTFPDPATPGRQCPNIVLLSSFGWLGLSPRSPSTLQAGLRGLSPSHPPFILVSNTMLGHYHLVKIIDNGGCQV